MDILVVGLSLGRAALEELEALRRPEALDRAEQHLLALDGVRELVRVATCHRVEFILGVSSPWRKAALPAGRSSLEPLLEGARRALQKEVFLHSSVTNRSESSESTVSNGSRTNGFHGSTGSGTSGSPATNGSPALNRSPGASVYALAGTEAYRHLLRVAIGLESPLRGETEILGQLRAAYSSAVDAGKASKILNGVFHRIFRAARRIRARAGLEARAPSWSEFLAAAITEHSSLHPGSVVRLIGTGSLARSLSLSFRARGMEVLASGTGALEANVSETRSNGRDAHAGAGETSRTGSESVSGSKGGSATGFPRVIVTASGRGRLFGVEDIALTPLLRGASKARRPQIHMWDLGMPRNIDPSVAALPGVKVWTLGDVAALGASVPFDHDLALRAAADEVESEVVDYESWRRDRELSSSLVRLGRLLELLHGQPRARNGRSVGRETAPDDHNAEGRTGKGRTTHDPAGSTGAPATSSPDTRGYEVDPRDFGRRLLRAFAEVSAEAADEIEATARIALFEQALEKAVRVGQRSGNHSEDGASRATHLEGSPKGRVSLVGAGPGDEGLLTLTAVDRLQGADVVYYDALVTRGVLEYCRPGARLVPVGKRRGSVSLPQVEIEAAMVRDARDGRAVVRLKGGDPFVFGRGGEEALAMARAGILFEVVPGVTSGVAAPAAAGIPLTHRGIAGSAAFVTAHDLSHGRDGERAAARLRHLAQGADTLVLFMGGSELARAKRTLIDAGLSPRTPAALIENGTTAEQRVVTGRLEALDCFDKDGTGGPVLVVIGETVALAETLRLAGRLGVRQPGRPNLREIDPSSLPTTEPAESWAASATNAALNSDFSISRPRRSHNAGTTNPRNTPRSRTAGADRRAG